MMKNHTYLMAFCLELATGIKVDMWELVAEKNFDALVEAFHAYPLACAYYNYFMDLAFSQHLTKEGE